MGKLESLIFDFDGVVVDSELARDKVTGKLVDSFGHQYDRDKLKPKMSGKSEIECMQVLIDEYQIPQTPEKLAEMRREEIKSVYRTVGFIPGFLEFYTALLEAFPLPTAIATSLERSYFALVDERLSVTEMFNGQVYHTETLGISKPDPAIFQHAASNLSTSAEYSAVFEDAPSGVAASLRAGSRTIALTRTFTEEILRSQTAKILERPLEDEVLFIPDYSPRSLENLRNFLE